MELKTSKSPIQPTVEAIESMQRNVNYWGDRACKAEAEVERLTTALEDAMKLDWKCRAQPTADPPSDCDWPMCGCDPHALKVIEALEECGALAAADVTDRP